MIVLVVMVMVVAAPAGMAMLVVVMVMRVLVLVGMSMVLMRMVVTMMPVMVMVVAVMVVMMVVIADMGAALRLERALDRRHGAALAAGEFRESRIVLDVEGVVRDLGETMVGSQVPSKTHEAQGVLRPHLQQAFGLRLYLNEAAVLQAKRIAVVDGGFHVEIEQDLGAALTLQRCLPAAPRLVIEGHRVNDTVGLHGGLADNGGDAGHGFISGGTEDQR